MNEKSYWFIKSDPTFKNNLMAFGFMCDKGWYPIIFEAFDRIEALIEGMPEVQREHFKKKFQIVEVKEKYGGLRIYTSITIDEIETIIEDAANKADKTCERCGKPGCLKIRNGWYRTLCKDCLEG